MAQTVDRELDHVTDMAPLEIALDDASLEPLARLHRTLERRRAACIENIANADSFGFKRRVVVQVAADEAVESLDMSEGEFKPTKRQLDVAIHGRGFFCVKNEDGGDAFTRCGNFFVDPQGYLVLGVRGGPRLMPSVTVPVNTTDVSIGDDGLVRATVGNGSESVPIGQIQLTAFGNPSGLRSTESGLYVATPLSGEMMTGMPGDSGFGRVAQNELEQSNVDLTLEREALLRVDRQIELIDRLIARRESDRATTRP